MSIAVVDGDDIFSEICVPTRSGSPGRPARRRRGTLQAKLIDSEAHPSLSRGLATPISSVPRDDFVLPKMVAEKLRDRQPCSMFG